MRNLTEFQGLKTVRERPQGLAGGLIAAALLLAVPAFAQDKAEQLGPEPAVVVQVQFVPGGRGPWLEAFETQLSDFAYYEAVVPGQSYDLMLILNADSFAFFDHRRPFPHYVALFQKTGVHEGRRILSEMLKWEADVSVSLLRAYGADR
jgi:hypothetical protein